jgi:hypothetical protein
LARTSVLVEQRVVAFALGHPGLGPGPPLAILEGTSVVCSRAGLTKEADRPLQRAATGAAQGGDVGQVSAYIQLDIPGLLARGERPEIAPVGTTFPETEENAPRWRRWHRFLTLEMWAIFVPGAVIGMLMPGILVSYLAEKSGVEPTIANMPTFVADQLRATGEGGRRARLGGRTSSLRWSRSSSASGSSISRRTSSRAPRW